MDLTTSQPSPEGLPDPTTVQPPPSAQDLQPSAQDSPQREVILYGAFGLRALWSLLIYFAIIGTLIGSIVVISHQARTQREHAAAIAAAKSGKPAPPLQPLSPKPDASQPQPITAITFGEIILFAGFFLLSWLMAIIEHRSLSVFGLGGAHPIRRCLTGAFWGFVFMALLIVTLHTFRLLSFDRRLDRGPSILYWAAIQLFAFLLVGLTEEYTMRGYLQFTLTRGMVSLGNRIAPAHARTIAFWIAAVFTSALFFYLHTRNAGENWLGLLGVFLAGVVFVFALWRTGSLWWGIGFHTTWDWSQSFLYGVPDSGGLMQGRLFATHAQGNPLFSGGTAGPEGSLLCTPVFLLILLVLLYTQPSPQPPLEPTS
jgi:hypothetical protein